MAEMPDVQKVINVIMENPALISEISELMSKKEESRTEKPVIEEAREEPPVEASVSEPSFVGESGRRNKLLYAMKPYLSKERQRAMDTVIGVLDVLHTVRGR